MQKARKILRKYDRKFNNDNQADGKPIPKKIETPKNLPVVSDNLSIELKELD